MTTNHIAAYIRVSSKAQSHAMQRHAIEQAAAHDGRTIGHWYTDKQSAKTTDRPGLNKLRADVQARRVSRLYVYRIDRLARTGIRDTLEILDECKRCGCVVVNLADGFALDGPVADVVIAVMAWSAQMERLAINERIAAARLRMEAEGKGWGRPASYDVAQAERVNELSNAGGTVRGIAAEVGLSKSAVARILSRNHAPESAVATVEDRAI
jgi:DNA invertase Pin-like site-specific DNA recombinase